VHLHVAEHDRPAGRRHRAPAKRHQAPADVMALRRPDLELVGAVRELVAVLAAHGADAGWKWRAEPSSWSSASSGAALRAQRRNPLCRLLGI
jgi:hypothetical protein